MSADRFHFYRPALPLATHVELLWFVGGGSAIPKKELVLPSTSVEMVIALHDDPYHLCAADASTVIATNRGGIVCGLRQNPVVLDLDFKPSDMGVHFKPGGAAAVLGVPVDQLGSTHVQFADVLGPDAEDLRDALRSTDNLIARFRLLEAYLIRRVQTSRRADPGIQFALDAFDRPAGRACVEAVGEQLGWTRKKLAGRFSRSVGLTPKRYCRIRRMEHVLNAMQAPARRRSWASLAAEAGYFDQSHMINDFRELTGLSPTEYVNWDGAMANHLPL